MKTVVNSGVRFVCDSPVEEARARTLFTKEPGTIAWLDAHLRHTDVFYDIGANIGCYTLYAARLIDADRGGVVYAFEPRLVNAVHLLRNVQENGAGERARVCAIGLDDHGGFEVFRYLSLIAGVSGGQVVNGPCTDMLPVVTIDSLVALGVIRPATLVKIDVDGTELRVLKGMEELLRQTPPRSLQVEMAPSSAVEIIRFLAACGYQLHDRHFTMNGQQAIERGQDPITITDNAIFTRAA